MKARWILPEIPKVWHTVWFIVTCQVSPADFTTACTEIELYTLINMVLQSEGGCIRRTSVCLGVLLNRMAAYVPSFTAIKSIKHWGDFYFISLSGFSVDAVTIKTHSRKCKVTSVWIDGRERSLPVPSHCFMCGSVVFTLACWEWDWEGGEERAALCRCATSQEFLWELMHQYSDISLFF